MRRRVLISIFLGIFTQMSGNTLLSYYSGKLFDMMGFTAEDTKTRINLANACWGFINATTLALIITRFRRRVMFMVSATSMCLVFIAMTVSLQRIQVAQDAGTTNQAAGISGLFWYFAYSPCYNLGNNALTYTYLVELWPYSHRSRGIGVQQIFGKLAGFFSTNVNSIALDAIKWIYLAIYCGWIFFELCIVYWLYPETSGRTLEELAFRKLPPCRCIIPPFSPPDDDSRHDHDDTLADRLFFFFFSSPFQQCSRTAASTSAPCRPSRSRSTTATPTMSSRTRASPSPRSRASCSRLGTGTGTGTGRRTTPRMGMAGLAVLEQFSCVDCGPYFLRANSRCSWRID
jgi:hypothetical protein